MSRFKFPIGTRVKFKTDTYGAYAGRVGIIVAHRKHQNGRNYQIKFANNQYSVDQTNWFNTRYLDFYGPPQLPTYKVQAASTFHNVDDAIAKAEELSKIIGVPLQVSEQCLIDIPSGLR